MGYADPDEYPKRCTISAEELEALKRELTYNENFICYTEEWPPTDYNGLVYPIWFKLEDLGERGRLSDHNGRDYNPFTGNLVPTPTSKNGSEKCNVPVSGYRERYPNARYCSAGVVKGSDACKAHQHRRNMAKTAEEHLQTGFFSSSIDHLFANLDPMKKMFAWGTFESLMGMSNYEFAPEYRTRQLDFSNSDIQPDHINDDGTLDVDFAYPTQYLHPALALYQAACQEMKILSVQPLLMKEDEKSGPMERHTVQQAQLTSPTESDPSQHFEKIEGLEEHHLNLPLSRVIKDQKRLLKLGGVEVDPSSESNSDQNFVEGDVVLEIDAESEIPGVDAGKSDHQEDVTDPNKFRDMKPESQRIVDSVNESIEDMEKSVEE